MTTPLASVDTALAHATQETEKTLLRLLRDEALLRQQLHSVRRDIGLALSAHRRAFPAVSPRVLAHATGINRTTIWEIEVARIWHRSSFGDTLKLAAAISRAREAILATPVEALPGAQ